MMSLEYRRYAALSQVTVRTSRSIDSGICMGLFAERYQSDAAGQDANVRLDIEEIARV